MRFEVPCVTRTGQALLTHHSEHLLVLKLIKLSHTCALIPGYLLERGCGFWRRFLGGAVSARLRVLSHVDEADDEV